MEHTQDNPASQQPPSRNETAQQGAAENVAAQTAAAQGANAQGANAQTANAQGANTQGANAQGANAQGANAQGANAQGANAQGANPQGHPGGPGAATDAALAEAQAKIAELNESFLRAKAETENVRRRAADDVTKARKFAIESFAEHLLPVLDSLEAALGDTSGDATKLREGVELTLRQLSSAMEKGRVTAVNPVGEKFDPHRHQAISMVPAEQEPNTVVSVLQKGYVIADRVLRPALVTVAAPK